MSDLFDEIPEEIIDKEEQNAEKAKRIEIEKKELLNRVVSGNIEDIKDRVAFILNTSNDARNSDIDLAWAFWKSFESDILSGNTVSKEQLKNLTKQSSLSRIRAKIQNEYKLFQADDIVKQYRGVLEKEKKKEAVEDKPKGIGIYSVFIDETGKNQDFLSVGSLWALEGNIKSVLATLELKKWKTERNIDFEFHFSELSKHRILDYKDFFIKFLSLFPTVGFKIIVVNNKGFKTTESAIVDLTYHLLNKGIDHENESGRATLPRILQVWIDEEETGSDKIKLENIKERITSQNKTGLHLGDFQAVSSKDNFSIQAVDLFTGSINRKLHNSNGTNFKDEFADFILNSLGFDINEIDKENGIIDNSKVFDLK